MAKWCDSCRKLSLETHSIYRPKNFHKVILREYIDVCPRCIEENNWQSEQHYIVSDLQHLVDKYKYNINPTLLETTDGKQYLAFSDQYGQILPSKELKFIADSILETIKLKDIDEELEELNEFNSISTFLEPDPEVKEKFLVPFNKLRIGRKRFNQNKRKWSFVCGNCSVKVSSDSDDVEYFSIMPEYTFDHKHERACSEGCAYVIAKDIVQNWISENQYERFIDHTKLELRLNNYIRDIQ